MSKYSQENSGRFEAAMDEIGRFEADMEEANWTAVRDDFGIVHNWIHNGNGRVVPDVDALNYWQMAQTAPVPF